ncbi:MAG TPA: hypothetical protein VIU12_18715 [Chryseolinea sp.]
MNINDVIELFKMGKATAKSHMRNLIEIAAADGGLGTEEQRLLNYAAQRNNISSPELQEMQRNPSNVRFQVPASDREKFNQMYDLVHMMSVDRDIHVEEQRLCEIFAIKFGFRQEIVREMIVLIRQNIEKWVGPEETMHTVMAKMKVFD